MDHKFQNRKKSKIYFLLIILAMLSIYTAYQAYKAYTAPHPILAVKHFLVVDVLTDKDYKSLEEVMGASEIEQTTVILPTGGIYFYKPGPGWNVTKHLNLTNAFIYPVELETNLTGNISQFLTIDLPKNTLEPNEFEVMSLTVKIPKDHVIPGQYHGNLTISFIPKKT